MTSLRILGLALLFSLSGCGGGDEGEEQNLSAPEFRQRAEAICEKSWSQITALGQPGSPEQLRAFLDKSIPIIEETSAGFDDLTPPDELAEDWDEFTDLSEENLEVTRDLQQAVDENDVSRATTLYDVLGSINAAIIRAAQTLGLEGCVQPPP